MDLLLNLPMESHESVTATLQKAGVGRCTVALIYNRGGGWKVSAFFILQTRKWKVSAERDIKDRIFL